MSEAEKIVEDFKVEVKKKCKSLRRYCKLSGEGYYDLNLLLTNYVNNPTQDRANAINTVIEKFRAFDVVDKVEGEVSKDDVEKVAEFLEQNYQKVSLFMKEHPQFDKFFISRFLNNKVKTTNNPLVNELFKICNINN